MDTLDSEQYNPAQAFYDEIIRERLQIKSVKLTGSPVAYKFQSVSELRSAGLCEAHPWFRVNIVAAHAMKMWTTNQYYDGNYTTIAT